MLAKLIVAFIVIAFDCRVLDRSVHPLDLAVCPGVIDFGQPVFDFVFIANTAEDVPEGIFLPGLIGELDAVVGQNRMDPVGNGFDKVAQEVRGNRFCMALMEFHIGQLRALSS